VTVGLLNAAVYRLAVLTVSTLPRGAQFIWLCRHFSAVNLLICSRARRSLSFHWLTALFDELSAVLITACSVCIFWRYSVFVLLAVRDTFGEVVCNRRRDETPRYTGIAVFLWRCDDVLSSGHFLTARWPADVGVAGDWKCCAVAWYVLSGSFVSATCASWKAADSDVRPTGGRWLRYSQTVRLPAAKLTIATGHHTDVHRFCEV